MILLLSIFPLILISSSGLLVNLYLFIKFFSKHPEATTEFNKLCHAKTIPNILVCSAFLFWASPLSALELSLDKIPNLPNVFIGQVAVVGSYMARPSIQLFMSINIWFSVYFPLKKLQIRVHLVTSTALIVVWLSVTAYVIRAMIPLSCGVFYDPLLFIWTSEARDCWFELDFTAISVVVLSVISNVFTLATLSKLCCDRVGGLSSGALHRRRNRRVRLFVQSMCQDCLHIIDVINWKIIAEMNSDVWFQFLFSSISLLSIHALDGFVMLYFHNEFHPKVVKRVNNQTTLANITVSY